MEREMIKTVEIRTARNQHTCGWCHLTIHPRQSYLQLGRGRYCCTPPATLDRRETTTTTDG